MLRLLSVLAVMTVSAPAFAGPPSGGNSGGGTPDNHIAIRFTPTASGTDAEEIVETEVDDDPRVVNLPAVVAPLSQNGRLTGYAYARLRMRVAPGVNAWTARDNMHYALHHLIRAAHSSDLSNERGDDLDYLRAGEVWIETLREYYGAESVENLEIRNADVRLFLN